MAFIQVHQSLLSHRKTLRLARLLALDRFAVVGRLVALWSWGLDNAQHGIIQADDIEPLAAIVMDWAGDPHVLFDALVAVGFLEPGPDGTLLIHDWDDYAGRLIERREQDAERKRRSRASGSGTASGHPPSRPQDVRVTSVGHPPDVQRREEKSREENIPEYHVRDFDADADAAPLSDVTSTSDADSDSPSSEQSGAAEQPESVPPPAPLKMVKPAPKPLLPDDAPAMALARTMRATVLKTLPTAKVPPNTTAALQRWAREFDLMLRVDNRPPGDIRAIMAYAHAPGVFWRKVILSPDALRAKFDKIMADRNEQRAKQNGHSRSGPGANGSAFRQAEPHRPVPAAAYDVWKDDE